LLLRCGGTVFLFDVFEGADGEEYISGFGFIAAGFREGAGRDMELAIGK
jgi:hypothetical protein